MNLHSGSVSARATFLPSNAGRLKPGQRCCWQSAESLRSRSNGCLLEKARSQLAKGGERGEPLGYSPKKVVLQKRTQLIDSDQARYRFFQARDSSNSVQIAQRSYAAIALENGKQQRSGISDKRLGGRPSVSWQTQ